MRFINHHDDVFVFGYFLIIEPLTAEQHIIESAWEAQWLLEYVKSARALERQPRA